MMKPAGLKGSCSRTDFRQPVFPETEPAFDRELQITRSAEQMKVVGHKQIITYEPCCGLFFPDLVQGGVDGSLCQPAFPLAGANR